MHQLTMPSCTDSTGPPLVPEPSQHGVTFHCAVLWPAGHEQILLSTASGWSRVSGVGWLQPPTGMLPFERSRDKSGHGRELGSQPHCPAVARRYGPLLYSRRESRVGENSIMSNRTSRPRVPHLGWSSQLAWSLNSVRRRTGRTRRA